MGMLLFIIFSKGSNISLLHYFGLSSSFLRQGSGSNEAPASVGEVVLEMHRKSGDDECIALYTYGELDLKDN